MSPEGTQLVSPQDNAAGLPPSRQNQSNCDAATEQKERDLGALCARENALGHESYFWTAMLKSGAMNVSERGHLCGLWCLDKKPSGCVEVDSGAAVVAARDSSPVRGLLEHLAVAAAPATTDDDYSMRQPLVKHAWSAPDGSGGYTGSFYGTYDLSANLSALPPPADVIDEALHPHPDESCALDGIWLGGNGNASLPIAVASTGNGTYLASCEWPSGGSLPAPWHNQSLSVSGNRVTFAVEGHIDTGVALPCESSGSLDATAELICYSATSYWCRGSACAGAAKACAGAKTGISSYFGLEWFVRDGRRIFRNIVRCGDDLDWIMLYTGPEAATGGKGGYPWDGRGQYAPVPVSTTRNASTWPASAGKMPLNNFKVRMWTNITLWAGGPGFYFLNHGACWKDSGAQCDGDLGTDVTRYLLFQLPKPGARSDDADRCGPLAHQRQYCPQAHTYRNGTTVRLGEPGFPYRAYHSVSRRSDAQQGSGFKCKHDCWSNPCDQDWVRIEPSPEWAEYGYPASVSEAMQPHTWEMDVGAVTAACAGQFSGTTPPVMYWPTLNMGPEMSGAPGSTSVWEQAEMDVLVDASEAAALS